MKKEYVMVAIIGLFLLSYVLEAAVNPLNLPLSTPYEFINPRYLTLYPFTATTIVIRGLGIFLTPLLLFSFIEGRSSLKGLILLILIGLMQLYALQDVATRAQVVPLEWSLSLSLAGAALAIPMIWYFVRGIFSSLHRQLGGPEEEDETPLSDSEEE
jgi:hypothetical protein